MFPYFLLLKSTKQYGCLNYISFLHYCAFLPATVEVLGTFLEAILWKPFQLFCRILHHVFASQSTILSVLILVEGTGKNQGDPGQESVGNAPVLSHCSLLRNPWPKLTGVLEHCHEEENSCWFSIFWGRFLLTTSLRRQRMSVPSYETEISLILEFL